MSGYKVLRATGDFQDSLLSVAKDMVTPKIAQYAALQVRDLGLLAIAARHQTVAAKCVLLVSRMLDVMHLNSSYKSRKVSRRQHQC